ncbi:alginate lyase family protein [Paenibacillus bouchesdurhonensis]|uniref:alginate lyase family protein n=1 Tax=Paenibacillus bouchesdurhonensis TaxID=1870990 RepID=UPI000DA60A0B|nr:alginate lyase family protein [Paenibacillus bouchesdurhonensis]
MNVNRVDATDEDKLRSLFSLLNLEVPELADVAEAVKQNRNEDALLALHRYYRERQVPGCRLPKEETAQITGYVKKYCADEAAAVLKTADEVVDQTFLFQFPWDMERTQVPVTFDDAIDWHYIPEVDPEWAYMLNRHRYWIALGQAYAMTGDHKYAAAFCRQLEDWIDSNPVPHEPASDNLAWRTIEAGLRGSNWIKTLRYVWDCPQFTPSLLAILLISLAEHARYLVAAFTSWKRISNWGVLETSGLLQIALSFPEFTAAGQWRSLAEQRLEETTQIQVMADGIHWEQSPTYHHEVMSCYLDSMYFAKINRLELDEDFRGKVYEMAIASLYWAKPNHRQPMFGDSDDNDVRSLLTYAAALFKDETLRFRANPRMDYDSAWLLGIEGIRSYDRMASAEPPELSHAFVHSGHYVMRSGWSEQDLYLYFHCGPLGGGHGHADLLHFDLYAYGKEFLTDLGRYNYSDHTPLRKALKESAAHNTTTVDGIGFTEIADTWSYHRIARPSGSKWVSRPAYDYVEGSHDGYLHLDDPVLTDRRIIFIKPYYWLLVDRFRSKEAHMFRQHFHFAPGGISLEEGSLICRTQNKDEANLLIIPIQSQGLRAEISEGVISREYNLLEPNHHVTYSRSGSGITSMMQVLYPLRPGETERPQIAKIPVFRHTGEQVDDAQAEACRIIHPELNSEHILVISHRVPSGQYDSYVVDGVQIFGEVVLISGPAEKRKVNVIN